MALHRSIDGEASGQPEVGILIVAYSFAMGTYRRRIS
jgi:hypothetical protein